MKKGQRLRYVEAKESVPIAALETSVNDGELPEWYRLLPEGDVHLADGIVITVDEAAFERVDAHFRARGVDLVFDYEHQTRSVPPVQAPASGWATELKWDAGICAKINWTAPASEKIKNKEYRYFSPGMYLSGGKIVGLDHAALTNVPRINSCAPLTAKTSTEEIDLEFPKKVAEMLGLSVDMTEDEVLQELRKLVEKSKQEAEPEVREMIPAKLTAALGLAEGSSVELVLAKFDSMQNQLGPVEQMQLELAKLKEQAADRDAKSLLDKYGKKFTPAMLQKNRDDGKPFWLELAKSDPAGFEMVVEQMPDQIPDPLPKQRPASTSGDSLTPDQLVIAKSFGMTPEEFAKEMEGSDV